MMRKQIKKILVCLAVALLSSTQVFSQSKEVFDWSKVIDAIIQVESQGNPNAYNKNGNCVGILQITPLLVKQCNIWLKSEKNGKRYTLQDRYNVEKSKEMFIMVQNHYNPSHNVEKAVRLWNGGPGYTIKGTNGYYRKFLKHYKK